MGKLRSNLFRDKFLIFAAVAFTCVSMGYAEPANDGSGKITVEEVVDKTNYVSYYQGNDGRAEVKMAIVDSNGNKRNREFTILRWDLREPPEGQEKEGMLSDAVPEYMGRQRFYVYFHRPPDWAKTVFMVHKYLTKDDDRWLYQPALDLVNRISGADKRNSFVGSHFVYEDVSGRNVKLDKHEPVDITDNYYVVKNTPKDPQKVKFSYYKMWIHKKSFIVVQTSYYDKQNREYRRYKVLGVKTVQGFPTVVKSKMSDLNDGSYTVMQYTDVKYNIGIDKDIFTKRYLKQAPRQYIK